MIVIDFMETTKCQWSCDSWPKPEVVDWKSEKKDLPPILLTYQEGQLPLTM